MKLFWMYLKQHQKGIFAFFLFCAVFFFSFGLFHLPLKAVFYPVMLCFLLGCFLIMGDFCGVKRRHEKLCEIKHLTAAMISSLPAVTGIEIEDYQTILRTLQTEATDNAALAGVRYQNMMEYYTIWAHQIKTPITSMRLSLEKEDSPLSRKLSADLSKIEQYVEMVLAFLRLDSDSTDYVFKEYNIDHILKQSISKFASEFIDRNIRLDYTPSDKRVVTDEKWLSFVIEQLLSNALKYTCEGSIKIYMQEQTLCIDDTGIGIAPNDLPRIFEKGYTGHNGRQDKRASGIGLYLCKRICTSLGTTIRITSQPGKGTNVRIDLKQYQLREE